MSSVKVQVVRNPPRDRSILENISGRLRVSITSLTYLHIGSGDKIILETEENKLKELIYKAKDIREVYREIKFQESLQFSLTKNGLTIPGSSIKGNIRARLELSFRNVNGKVNSCLQKARILRTEPAVGEQGWRHYKIWGEVLREDRGTPCNYTTDRFVCLICDLFGTTGLKGVVEFSDFIQDRISIEIIKLPFGMELTAVKQDSHFTGFINFYNLKPEEIGLVLIGMGLKDGRVGRPLLLGRLKYRGKINGREFGKVRYEVDSLTLFRYSKPLKLKDVEIGGGQEVSGEALDRIVKLLTDHASRSYNGLHLVYEVEQLEKLR
ncbi:MAG: RAMP superfamily CRISPR-associated protein [Nitrososphaeria archaeon]|nr:RAMP superfamily CRISPR-associated protein [Nitrososphaeria archaeon]